MLIVLFTIFLLMIGIGFLLVWFIDSHTHPGISLTGAGGIITGCMAEVIIVIAVIVQVCGISQLKVADQKISMYEEENAKIEQDITTIVKDYMNYEKDTYKIASEQIDGSSLLVLTELYPDLKSNELIKKQIEIYTENNNKIKQLKEEKINNQTCKWWLYFGKVENIGNKGADIE